MMGAVTTDSRSTAEPRPLLVGVEFGNDPAGAPRVPPSRFAGVARAVKIANVRWGDCEPILWPSWWPESWRYSHGWIVTQLDDWRRAGFDRLTVVLKCWHRDLTAPTYTPPAGFSSGYTGIASAPPRDESAWKALDRWARRWLRDVRGRVQVVECESEWQSPAWWLGGFDEYMRWLRLLRAAVRDVSPEVKVCLGGHSLDGLLDDDPDDDEINARILSLPEPQRSVMARALDLGRRALATGEFDQVDIHSLGDPAGIEPNVRRVRELLPAGWAGEVTIGDAFPCRPLVPSPGQWLPGVAELVGPLVRREPWAVVALEELQTLDTVAKIAAAQRAGCSAIHFGPLYDWNLSQPTPYPWQGLTRPDGSLRPVCETIRAAQP